MSNKELELYLHIPFCKKKCNYCDFVSFAGKEACIDAYVKSLCAEIAEASKSYSDRIVTSIYIGGGTPSLLSADQLRRIVNTLKTAFRISDKDLADHTFFKRKSIVPRIEFSIECNPGTVDEEKLRAYKKLGINRLSIGLQSTDSNDLKMLGRIHTLEDFENTFSWARSAGFRNINVDLMQAIPGQGLNAWKKVLALISTWMPEHISAYSLIIEEGTLFEKWQQEGRLPLPDEETERQIYYYTKEFLEKAGYHRYEISNYAKPDRECRHNIGYWKRKNYLGLGLHASSMIDNVRWKNTDDLEQYISNSEDLGQIREEREVLSHNEQMEEYLILGLRMMEGINKQEFLEIFGQDFDFTFAGQVSRLCAEKLLEDKDGNVSLTEKGIDVSNMVLSEFML